jgi:hypothetical protein
MIKLFITYLSNLQKRIDTKEMYNHSNATKLVLKGPIKTLVTLYCAANTSVCIALGYGLDDRVSIPGIGKKGSCPDRL